MTVSADSPIGSEFIGYRVEELVGRGGMGVVYRAHDPRLKRDVALKVLAPEVSRDERYRERFHIETELAASVEHPNIVPIHDAGEVDHHLYLVMRYVEGRDLKKLLVEEGPLEPARALAICAQVADALDAAHERGLIHRDVKPSNVLLDSREHAYLADFGLTRRLADQAPGYDAGLSLGTPAYVAPEQIMGREVDGRADQYSLACLMYESLAGRPPFSKGSEAATLFAHLEERPPALPGLDEVLGRALAKEPGDRYASNAEFVADARRALGISEPPRARWPLAVAAIGVALIAAALLAFFLTSGESPPPLQEGRLLRIDPAVNTVTSSVPIGDGPEAVAVGSGRVWVASYRDGSLWQLDPATESVTKIPAFGRPYAIAMHEGSAFIAALGPGKFAGNVSTYDAVSGGRVGGVALFACSLTDGGRLGVWAAGCPDVQLLGSQGSTQDPRILATVPIPYARRLTAANFREALVGIDVGEGGVWVVGDASDRRLWRVDPLQRRITATIELGFPPGGVAVGGGAIWVTDQLGDRLVRIDAASNRIVGSIPVGRGAGAVAFGEGSVWVGGSIDHTLTRVDPGTNEVVARIHVRASPHAIAVGDGGVWVVGDAR